MHDCLAQIGHIGGNVYMTLEPNHSRESNILWQIKYTFAVLSKLFSVFSGDYHNYNIGGFNSIGSFPTLSSKKPAPW